MKKSLRKLLNKKDNPAKQLMGTFNERPSLSIAALTSVGAGLVVITSAARRSPGRKRLVGEHRQADKERSYYDAAPRSISGRHSSYESYMDDSGGMIRKGGPVLLGSAAILTGIYFLGKRK